MPCTFNCLGYFALELQGSTGQTAGKDLSLLVEEPLEELSVLVIHVFDVRFLEAAVFFLLLKRQYFFFFTSTVGGLRNLISLFTAMAYSSFAAAVVDSFLLARLRSE